MGNMNKKKIIVLILVAVLGLVAFLITKTIAKINHKKEVTEQLATIPELPVEIIGTNKKPTWEHSNVATIILFFNSECNHCQYEAQDIQSKLDAFKNTNLLFVSEEPTDKIQAFSNTYKLDNQPNIWWLKMKPEYVYNTFGTIGVPHIWVYNKEGMLVKEFRGETKVEALLEWL